MCVRACSCYGCCVQPKWERVVAAKEEALLGGGQHRIDKQHEKVGAGAGRFDALQWSLLGELAEWSSTAVLSLFPPYTSCCLICVVCRAS